MEEEFNAWYDTEHLPERLAIPGFRSARRWVRGGTYLATYELDSPEVLQSPYLERFRNQTPGRAAAEQVPDVQALGVHADRARRRRPAWRGRRLAFMHKPERFSAVLQSRRSPPNRAKRFSSTSFPTRDSKARMFTASTDLERYAWLSIAAALATITLKTLAWWLTGSVGLLSDALESIVNLAAPLLALPCCAGIAIPTKPSRAGTFAAGIEGALIVLAAAGSWRAPSRA